MSKMRGLVVLAAMCVALAQLAWAADNPTVYVNNERIGSAVPVGGVYYVAADAYAKASKSGLTVDPDTTRIRLSGKSLPLKALRVKKGQWLVPLEGVAMACGLKVRVNQKVGLIDVYQPVQGTTIPEAAHGKLAKRITVLGFADRYRQINRNQGGQEIDIKKHMTADHTNLFFFYSPHCTVCVNLAPELKELVRKTKDAVVSIINVDRPSVNEIDWESPTAQQYKLDSVPYFLIYDGDGNKVSEGDEAYRKVVALMQEAGISDTAATKPAEDEEKPSADKGKPSDKKTPAAPKAAPKPAPAASPAATPTTPPVTSPPSPAASPATPATTPPGY